MYHRGLERGQFLMNCRIGHCDGLERSQLEQFSAVYKHRVLK